MKATTGSAPGLGERLTLPLFLLMMALLLADNNLMAPNLTAIGHEFGFTGTEIDKKLGGDINLMFWLLGAGLALFVGYFADRADLAHTLSRKRLLLLLVIVGQAACLASGLAQTYPQLYWARTLTAVGIGAAGPVIGSMLADQVPPERRPRALALLTVACSLGIGAGQSLAGMTGPRWGWRTPFLVVGTLGLLVSVVYALLGREPRRGQHEPGLQALHSAGLTYNASLRLRDVPRLLRVRTNAFLLGAGLIGSVPYSVVMVYLNDYLAWDRGLGVPFATLTIMVIGAGGVVGNVAGGAIMQRLLASAPHRLPGFCGVSTMVTAGAAVLLLVLPISANQRPIGPLVVAFLFGFVLTLSSANPMILNVNLPDRRATMGSLATLCGDLGRGLGAWIVGLSTLSFGRKTAFLLAFLLWIPAGLLVAWLRQAFPREQQAVQADLQALAEARTRESRS